MTLNIHAPAPGQLEPWKFHDTFAHDSRVGLDFEYTGGGVWHPRAEIRLVQFGTLDAAFVLDLRDDAQRALARDTLLDEGRTFVAHSAGGAEIPAAMRAFNIDISPRIYDTLNVALLLYPGELENHGLKDFAGVLGDAGAELIRAEEKLLALFRLMWQDAGHSNGKAEEIAEYGWTNVPQRDRRYLRYAALDAIAVRRLAPHLAQLARSYGVYGAVEFEQRVARCGARMSLHGMTVDTSRVDNAMQTVGAENAAAMQEFMDTYGVKARSPKRVDVVAAQGVEFRVFNRNKEGKITSPKLSKEVLRELHDEYPGSHAVGTLLRAAETSNLTTFLTTLRTFLDSDNVVHPSITTLGAVSGRWRVVRPAVQTVSTKSGARKVFPPRLGTVRVSADLGQIEPRVAFELSGCKSLIELCRQGVDPYAAAATLISGPSYTARDRKVAKRIVLGTMFASGVATLTRQAKYTDGMLDIREEDIAAARDRFRASAPEVFKMAKRLQREPDIRLPSGRFAPHDPDRLYRAINCLVQGSARDFLMRCMLECEAAGLGPYMWLTMHDELLFDVPAELLDGALPVIEDIMSQGYRDVPTTTDIELFDAYWDGAGVPLKQWKDGVRQTPLNVIV